MPPKTPKAKSTTHRTKVIEIALTIEEHAKLVAAAERRGLPLAAFLRLTGLGVVEKDNHPSI